LSLQEYKNLKVMRQKDLIRILCLGESTTASGGDYSYPSQLEKILNEKMPGLKFIVINKGIPAVNTSYIVEHLIENLNRYNPDIVVTMMGCNDEGVRYYQDIPESNSWLFRHCRVYRFSRLIYAHILKKIKKEDIYGLNRLDLGKKAKLKDTRTIAEKTNLSNNGLIEKVTELNSKDDKNSPGLESSYSIHSKSAEIEDSFKKAINLNPKNDNAYVGLGWFYRYQGKYIQAERLFKLALKLNPRSDEACIGLGWVYRDKKNLLQARKYYKKAIELNPRNDMAYVFLGWSYRKQSDFNSAEILFKKAIQLNPNNLFAYFELSWLYRVQGKFIQAEELLRKGLEINPKETILWGALASLYQETLRYQEARSYYTRYAEYRKRLMDLSVSYNYIRLKDILDSRGIRLVAVQYPVRSVLELKNILREAKGVIFVDNEIIFKEAIKNGGYSEYFTDMFGGVFGHCTPKGNRLLADNIANQIIKGIVQGNYRKVVTEKAI